MNRKGHSSGRRPPAGMVRRGPRVQNFWTSAQAAELLGVGVSSIKRWTDAGELESVRTPGSHRRYTLAILHRFAAARGISSSDLPPLAEGSSEPAPDITLFEAMKAGEGEAVRRLVQPLVGEREAGAFLDRVVGDALRTVGEQWSAGSLSVAEEHRGSYLLADAIDRLRPAPVAEGPLAVLACPPGEWHELPLRMIRLLLEWNGWRTEFAGASLPWEDAAEAASRSDVVLLALSARSPAPFVADEGFAKLLRRCRNSRTEVIAGGAWARGASADSIPCRCFRTLHGFERWLRASVRF